MLRKMVTAGWNLILLLLIIYDYKYYTTKKYVVLLCRDPRVFRWFSGLHVFGSMLGWGKVFEFRFSIIESVVVDVVAFHPRRRVHDFSMHLDSDSFSVSDEAVDGVEAVLRTNQPPVELS